MIEFKSSQKMVNILHNLEVQAVVMVNSGFQVQYVLMKKDILYVMEVDNHRASVFEIMDSSEITLRARATSLPVLFNKASTNYTPPKFLITFRRRAEPFYYGGIVINKHGVVYVTDSYYDELQMFLV